MIVVMRLTAEAGDDLLMVGGLVQGARLYLLKAWMKGGCCDYRRAVRDQSDQHRMKATLFSFTADDN